MNMATNKIRKISRIVFLISILLLALNSFLDNKNDLFMKIFITTTVVSLIIILITNIKMHYTK